MSVLISENISKYNGETEVIKNFSYNFLENKVYAFISNDNYYQRRLLNLLSGKEKPKEGKVYIDGELLYNNQKMNERICYMSTETSFPSNMKLINIFKMMADFYPKWDNVYAYDLLRSFDININQSFGELEKKGVFRGILALASKANITILENPLQLSTIQDRYKFFKALYSHKETYSRTFILSTTFIDEISFLVDKFLFMDKGTLFETFTINQLNGSFRYLTGKVEVLKSLISGVKVVGVEERGKILTVCVGQKLTKDDKRKYQKYLIKISDVPINKIFIYLINLREMRSKL